ncbi:MAG: IS200/IS605 family transposase [Ignavibacteria bacterium]
MANTYTQIYIHFIFSVKNRQFLLKDNFREELHKYITGIVLNRKCKLLCINSVQDHMHILIAMHPEYSVSVLMKEVKSISSKFINEHKFVRGKFQWQEGFGAFSYSNSQVNSVINYIKNQEMHHKKKTFREEYLEFLEKFGVKYELKYAFDID